MVAPSRAWLWHANVVDHIDPPRAIPDGPMSQPHERLVGVSMISFVLGRIARGQRRVAAVTKVNSMPNRASTWVNRRVVPP